jgi:hypothetical protein
MTKDGFDDRYEDEIGRGGKRLGFDGRTESKYFLDGTALASGTFLARNCYEEHIRREDKRVTDRIIRRPGEPFPSVDELNHAIPKDQWNEGFNGEPEGQWKHHYTIVLLDGRDCSKIIFSNSTKGHRECYFELKESIRTKRQWQGEHVYPIVEPSCRAIKTKKYGLLQWPHLEIRGWRLLEPTMVALPAPANGELGKPAPEPSTEQVIDDSLPPWDDDFPSNLQK